MNPLAVLEDLLAQPMEVGEDDEAEFEVYSSSRTAPR
jgi:hypothetical protein